MNRSITLNYILFLVLSFAIIFGYSFFFSKPTEKEKPDTPQQAEKPVDITDPEIIADDSPITKPLEDITIVEEGEIIEILTPLYEASVDTLGGRIVRFTLNDFYQTTDVDSPEVELISKPEFAITSLFEINGTKVKALSYNYKGPKKIEVNDREFELVLTYNKNPKIQVTKNLTFNPETYLVNETIQVKNSSGTPLKNKLHIVQKGKLEGAGRGRNYNGFTLMLEDEVDRIQKTIKEFKSFAGKIDWFGFNDKYFTTSVIPDVGGNSQLALNPMDEEGVIISNFVYPTEVVPSGGSYLKTIKYFYGPKEENLLKAVGNNLEKLINYGWIESLAKIALRFLRFLNNYFNNFGISIIAITIIFRVAFLPLTVRSMKSMKAMQQKMQEIKPKIDAMKEKYKDDKTKQNQELMKLYTSHGVNPLSSLGGCLPLLIQLPIFVALYDVLLYSIELRHSPFLWIHDLAEPEMLFDIPGIGIPFRTLPLLMGVSWYISQKLTPTAAPTSDSMELQMKMMQYMPIIFTVMFWGLPSGLILYWTVSNILSIAQQLFINRQVTTQKGG